MTNRELQRQISRLNPDALAVVAISSSGDNLRVYRVLSVTDEWAIKEDEDMVSLCIDDDQPQVTVE